MVDNFDYKNQRFSERFNIQDGAWLFSILLICVLMLFNNMAWSIVGLALVYAIMGLHVLAHYKNLYGTSSLWPRRGMAFVAWLVSFVFVIVMPAFALYHYVLLARDTRKKHGEQTYKTVWITYIRMLILGLAAMGIYLLQAHIAAATYEDPAQAVEATGQ